MIWREKRVLLISLGVLLLANVLFFLTYRVRYEQRLTDQSTRLHQAETRLEQARARRVAAERQLASVRQIQRDIQDIYEGRWSTEKERLAGLIVEVRKLAGASGLTPRSIGLAEQSEKKDLRTRSVTISFGVQGTYQQVRRFINLMELSQQFMSIDQLSLAGGDQNQLTLNVRIRTLFREADDEPINPSAATRRDL